jgi:maleamate amidohydrolase
MAHAETLIGRWGERFPEEELRVLAEAGYGHRMGFGSAPALLVVDVTYSFCGPEPRPILEAIRENRRSCGDRAWVAIEPMRTVLDAARGAGIPVVFSTMRDPADPAYEPGLWGAKNARGTEDDGPAPGTKRDNDIVDELKPLDGEFVLAKDKPSIFHGTNLLAHLISRGVDSLIVCGGTASGCVYATAVDGFSHNYKVSVVADATFDRVESPRWASLLDIDMKYGDVVTSEDVIRRLGQEGERR